MGLASRFRRARLHARRLQLAVRRHLISTSRVTRQIEVRLRRCTSIQPSNSRRYELVALARACRRESPPELRMIDRSECDEEAVNHNYGRTLSRSFGQKV